MQGRAAGSTKRPNASQPGPGLGMRRMWPPSPEGHRGAEMPCMNKASWVPDARRQAEAVPNLPVADAEGRETLRVGAARTLLCPLALALWPPEWARRRGQKTLFCSHVSRWPQAAGSHFFLAPLPKPPAAQTPWWSSAALRQRGREAQAPPLPTRSRSLSNLIAPLVANPKPSMPAEVRSADFLG
jgi:hypothetical protein